MPATLDNDQSTSHMLKIMYMLRNVLLARANKKQGKSVMPAVLDGNQGTS